jgi:hypothetical protein
MFRHMDTARWLACALVMIAGTTPASAQRTTMATAGSLAIDDSKIEQSSCVLVLRGSTRVIGVGGTSTFADLPALTTAMTTTGLIDPAAKAALDLGPRGWSKAIRIEVVPAGMQGVKLTVSVDPSAVKQAEPSRVLMRELIERAKTAVAQSMEPRRQEIKIRYDEMEKRRAALRTSLESLRKRLREAEGYANRFASDPNQRQRVESELIAKRSRLQAIKDILPKDSSQEIDTALRDLVAAREALVAGLQKAVEQGKGDPLEVLRARAELAESRVRVAEGGRFPTFSPSRIARDERLSLEVDVAALEAQLKAMPEAIKPPVEDLQSIRAESFRLEAENNTVEQQYQQLRREYDQLGAPPTLVVLDGHAK